MEPASHILLVDGDPGYIDCLTNCLRTANYSVETAEEGSLALQKLEEQNFDLVILEQSLKDGLGMDFLKAARKMQPLLSIIMIAGFGTIEDAVTAMRAGAFDYLSKPIMNEELLYTVQRAMEQRALLEENRQLKAQLDRHRKLDNIIGTSEKMSHIFEVVESVAETRATVLITGESGTGKTQMARAIHQHSPRRDMPFVVVNCGALPDSLLESELFGHAKGAFTGAIRHKSGKFEEADGGTIFLDEIATSTPALQIKLLRVIQSRQLERVGETKTREVDVRIVLATNSELLDLVRAGEFREDLYYRINVINIELPPLRERHEDIPILIEHFLELYRDYHGRKVAGFSQGALELLLSHSWPGNIRELENAVERAVVLSREEVIPIKVLPPCLLRQDSPMTFADEVLPLKKALEEPEKLIILRALELNGWNRQKTAEMLQVNRTTLFHKMKKYELLASRGVMD